jgi:diadenosine tetraphosphatase ApaH/serine/threonine PP2A family protein phosphatase
MVKAFGHEDAISIAKASTGSPGCSCSLPPDTNPGWETLMGVSTRTSVRPPRGLAVLRALDNVAASDPEKANALMGEAMMAGRMPEWPAHGQGPGIHLVDRAWVTSLPNGFVTQGDLDLRGCVGLTRLPAGLVVGGNLRIGGCPWLRELPEGMVVNGGIAVRNCPRLKRLPAGLVARGFLSLGNCGRIRRLPDDLVVMSGLDLVGCSSLEGLPDGLTEIPGHLYLSGCQLIARLPERLRIAKDLCLAGCSAWDGRIPEGVSVGGNIRTDRHPYPGIPLSSWRAKYPHGEPTTHKSVSP